VRKLAIGLIALSGITGSVGGTAVLAANGNGEGHTPVVVCHWVPAAPAGAHLISGPDGGSYVVITVDDDGANGNKNLRAHAHHEHDIFDDPTCGQED